MAETPPSHGTTHVCDVCGAKVTELRRGRCWGCYSRWVEGRPVGLGAACVCCNDRRRDHLRMTEILRAWVPMCHNCHQRTLRLDPMPDTVEGVREALDRERRARERRVGKADTRVFPRERRGLERRHVGAAAGNDLLLLDDDILIIEESEDLGPLSRDAAGVPRDEETRIQLPPTPVTAAAADAVIAALTAGTPDDPARD